MDILMADSMASYGDPSAGSLLIQGDNLEMRCVIGAGLSCPWLY
jgi:hypothetical protein